MKNKIRNCPICEKDFIDKYGNSKFCSIACASKHRYLDKQIVVECSNCGKSINTTKQYNKKYPTQYCDQKCRDEHFKKRFSGENNPNYKNSGKRTCEKCGREYFSYNKNRKYCSLKCAYGKKVSTCEMCKKEFFVRRKVSRRFCSRDCYLKYVKENSNKIVKKCMNCEKEFTANRPEQIYCSYKCLGESKKELFKKDGNPRWNGGSNKFRGYDWKDVRNKIFIRDEGTCQICGEQESRISVHHIIPYRISKCNDEKNLVCLCDRCHPHEDEYYRKNNKPSKEISDIMIDKYEKEQLNF